MRPPVRGAGRACHVQREQVSALQKSVAQTEIVQTSVSDDLRVTHVGIFLEFQALQRDNMLIQRI